MKLVARCTGVANAGASSNARLDVFPDEIRSSTFLKMSTTIEYNHS